MTTVIEEIQAAPEVTAESSVPEAPTVPVEEPEKNYEYQPTDEHGRTLGGKQVIKFRTHEDLAEKLTQQNILLVRKLREQTKKQRLGIVDVEGIPETAPRYDEPLDFTPRQLTDEERINLSRDLIDPDKFDGAKDTLFESAIGAKPAVLRQTLTDLQTANLRLLATVESDAFVRDTPEYYKCPENSETILNWMVKNKLAPVRENFKYAFNELKKDGLIVDGPVIEESPVPVVEASVPAAPLIPPKIEASRVPTGLTRQQATDNTGVSRTVADEVFYDHPVKDRVGNLTGHVVRYTGLAAIEKMPADEFKRRTIRDKSFNRKYEQLLRDAEQKRSG